MMSKQKKVHIRGERLIMELSNYNTARVEGGRSSWQHDDRGDRPERSGKSGKGSKGEKGEKGEWAPRERGGKGWKGR